MADMIILKLPTALQEVSFDLRRVEESTIYTVTANIDEFVFKNPQVSTDTMSFKFCNINVQRNNDPQDLTVVFFLPGDANTYYTVEFLKPRPAEQFRMHKVSERIIINDC